MVHLRPVFNLSFSELILIGIIFSFVMAAGRVGKLGERVGSAMGGKRGPQPGDPVIRAREVPPRDAGDAS